MQEEINPNIQVKNKKRVISLNMTLKNYSHYKIRTERRSHQTSESGLRLTGSTIP